MNRNQFTNLANHFLRSDSKALQEVYKGRIFHDRAAKADDSCFIVNDLLYSSVLTKKIIQIELENGFY